MRFYIFPRFVNGEDRAGANERKTDKVFIRHAELCESIDGGIPYETDAPEYQLLGDPTVEEIANTVALAEELIAAALEDAGL